MKLRIKNATHYRERDLRRFLQEALKRYRSSAAHKVVEIYYARRKGKCGGHAPYGREVEHPHFALGFPKQDTLTGMALVDAAMTIAHELGHNRGLRHGEMRRAGIGCVGAGLTWQPTEEDHHRASWAADFEILAYAPQAAKPKLRAKPVADKLDHARRKLASAVTRRKRAATIEKKWQRRVRYLERRVA